jgi:hypothetical protein
MSCSRGPLHEYAPWLIAGFCYLMAILFIAYETSITRGWSRRGRA